MGAFKSLYFTLLPYLCFIPIGFILSKKNMIPKAYISKPLLFVLLPVLVIDKVLEASVSNIAILAVISFLLSFLMLIPAILVKRKLESSLNINILKSSYAYFNVAFFGIPVVTALFGEEGITVLICIYIGSALYGNIFGYIQVAKSRYTTRKAIKEVFRVPFIYAISVAVILKIFNVELPEVMGSVSSILGVIVSVAGMTIIGMSLTNIKFGMISWGYYARILGIRVLAAILIVILLLSLEFWLVDELQSEERQVMALISLFPIAVNLAVFASFLNSWEEEAALLILFSTGLSLILVPTGAAFLQFLIGRGII
ncbi:AEC family transporter [Sinomicrobium sp. M5D2P17]